MSKRTKAATMKRALGLDPDAPISKAKLKLEYNKWHAVHGVHPPIKQKPSKQHLSLKVGTSYLFKMDTGVYLEGEVIAESECYVIRLNKPEPNLMRMKKGFVKGVKSLLSPPPLNAPDENL